MCGSYLGLSPAEQEELIRIIRSVGRDKALTILAPELREQRSVFPTEMTSVLIAPSVGEIAVRTMQWGYPGYADRAQPNAKPRPLINAKAETAITLPTWRDSLLNRRCVIPSAGFYEWQHGEDKTKTQYLFALPGETVVFMAGIYRLFTEPGGAVTARFSVLTTEANASMREVHNRMPVVLRRDELADWFWGEWSGLLDRSAVMLRKEAGRR